MYIIYCLLIWSLVYLTPALAFFPRLLFTPLTAFAIPIISAFIIYLFTSGLIAMGYFGGAGTLLVALSLGLFALVRVLRNIKKIPFLWTKYDAFIYGIHCIILFPYFIRLGTHAFDRGDEIYSWNFWAIQHYFGELIDYSHTNAPYPQLFPKLLAFCYHLLGDIDLQLPIKATLIIFPWCMLTAIATVTHYRFGLLKGAYWLLFIFVLKVVGLAQFFDDGYADPVMTSGVIVSMALFWFSQQKSLFSLGPFSLMGFNPLMLAGLSVLCAIMAGFTKQAGLLWTLFSLPMLMLYACKQEKNWRWGALGAISLIGGLIWIFGEGQNFYNNQGVLGLSQGDRNVFEQMLYAINKYFVHHPALLLLMGFAVWASRKEKILKRIVLLFILPGVILWFLFGAYQLRLGQHLIAAAFFVWGASGHFLPSLQRWEPSFKALLTTAIALSCSIGLTLYINESWIKQNGLNLYAGGRQSLNRYFGKDADYIYTNLYSDPNATLWVPSRYLYGLFYKHTQLTTPDYSHRYPYNQIAVINELKHKQPDYVFTVSPLITDGGPASALLKEIILQCPNAFEIVSKPQSKYSFATYKVNKTILQADPCLLALTASQ